MKIKCDKCGKEAEEALEVFDYHFCNECRDDLNVITIHWVMRMCEFAQPRRKPAKAIQKIDWDKACALRLAGWTHQQIAWELGVKVSSINSQMHNRLEMYKHGMRWGAPLEKEDEEDDWLL